MFSLGNLRVEALSGWSKSLVIHAARDAVLHHVCWGDALRVHGNYALHTTGALPPPLHAQTTNMKPCAVAVNIFEAACLVVASSLRSRTDRQASKPLLKSIPLLPALNLLFHSPSHHTPPAQLFGVPIHIPAYLKPIAHSH